MSPRIATLARIASELRGAIPGMTSASICGTSIFALVETEEQLHQFATASGIETTTLHLDDGRLLTEAVVDTPEVSVRVHHVSRVATREAA